MSTLRDLFITDGESSGRKANVDTDNRLETADIAFSFSPLSLLSQGKLFSYNDSGALAAIGLNQDIGLIVPDAATVPLVLFSAEIITDGPALLEVYEDSDITGGTPGVPLNMNRNVADGSDTQLTENPTVNDVGTLMFSNNIGGFGQGNSTFGDNVDSSPFALKESSSYLIRLTAQAAINYDNVYNISELTP